MPTIRDSKVIRVQILPDNPSQLQYLQAHAPRRPNRLQQHTIREGEIKEYNFKNDLGNGPPYFGTTYKVQLAKDIDGNPIGDVDIAASIPNENTPLVRFDASKVILTEDNSVRNIRKIYYKIIVVLPGGEFYQSTWIGLTLKTRENEPS